MTNQPTLDQERLNVLRNLGVEFQHDYEYVGQVGTPERHRVDLPDTIAGITLPLSAAEWCETCQTDGEYYMGGCCGSMSALQDILNGAFRENGYLHRRSLASCGELIIGHDDKQHRFAAMTDEAFVAAIAEWKQGLLNPWEKLGVIYGVVKSVLGLSYDAQPQKHHGDDAEHPGSQLLYEVSNVTQSLTWQDLFEIRPDDIEHHRVQRHIILAKLIPVLEKLYARLLDLDYTFDGYAIVDTVTSELVSNGYGTCLFATEEEATTTINKWAQWAEGGAFAVRRAHFSMGDGLSLNAITPDPAPTQTT